MRLIRYLKRTLLKWIALAPEALVAHEYRELLRSGVITVGRHTYGRPRIMAYRGSERRVRIGSFCSISPGVEIITGGVHPADWVSLYPFRIKWGMNGAYQDGMPTSRGDVEIGSDVWLGTGVLILSGVKIGHGTVVAARSVVTRDIPPYSIAAGVPARVVRQRFSDDQIQRLLKIAWWDWPDARIQEAVPWLSSNRIDEFLARYGGP